MKTYEAKDIRNVLLVGHGGAGKTTLLEAMQFASGATTRMGTVEDGNTVSDFEPEEIKKGISVSLGDGAGRVERREGQRPGRARVRRLHRATSGRRSGPWTRCVLVVSAVDGVEVQTEVAWELAVEAGLPRAILINKLDRERASFERTLEQLVQAFGTQVAPLELPIGEEHDFEGVADLLGRKAYRYGTGPTATEGEWPDDIAGKAEPFREKLMEAVAESDDALLEKYLEEGELSQDEIVHGVKRGFAEARIAPVLCAAAARPIGVDRVLAVHRRRVPLAARPRAGHGGDQGRGGEGARVRPRPAAHGVVFKTVSDPFVGHITMFRVFSGTLRPDSSVYNATKGTEERIGQLFALRGKEHETRLGGAGGRHRRGREARAHHHRRHVLDQGRPGDAAGRSRCPNRCSRSRSRRRPRATRTSSRPRSRACARRTRRSAIERSDETHETVMYGMGEAHLDVQVERMKRKFGVEVDHVPGQDRVQARRVRGPGKAHRAPRQAVRWPRSVRDLQRSRSSRSRAASGFEFVDKIFGGAIPNTFIPLGREGRRQDDADGRDQRRTRWSTSGCTLVDGKFHTRGLLRHGVPDRGRARAQGGGGRGRRRPARADRARSTSSSPSRTPATSWATSTPSAAKIQGIESAGAGKQRVKASVPQAEVARYSIDLRSMTGGRAAFTMHFSHYEEVPSHLADKIIAAAQQEKEAAHK